MGSQAYDHHRHPALSPMPALVEWVEAFLQSHYSSISFSYSFRRNTRSCCFQCIHSTLPPIVPMYLPCSRLLVSSILCKPCWRNVSPHDSILMCYILSFSSSLCELGCLLSRQFFLVSFPSLSSNLGGYILSLITLFPDFMAIFYDSNCVRYGACVGGPIYYTVNLILRFFLYHFLHTLSSESIHNNTNTQRTSPPWWWSRLPLQQRVFDDSMLPEGWAALHISSSLGDKSSAISDMSRISSASFGILFLLSKVWHTSSFIDWRICMTIPGSNSSDISSIIP